jgi:hypothetical protein
MFPPCTIAPLIIIWEHLLECQFILAGGMWRNTGGASRRRWRRRVHGTALCQHKVVGKVTCASTLTQPHRSRSAHGTKAQCRFCCWHKHVGYSREDKDARRCGELTTDSEYMNVIVWGQQVSWWCWAFSGEAQRIGCNRSVHQLQSNITAQHSTSTHMYIPLSLVRFPS